MNDGEIDDRETIGVCGCCDGVIRDGDDYVRDEEGVKYCKPCYDAAMTSWTKDVGEAVQ